jgi:hypothetical protein
MEKVAVLCGFSWLATGKHAEALEYLRYRSDLTKCGFSACQATLQQEWIVRERW